MQLSQREMELFTAACADEGNAHAQELVNLFGAEEALDILGHLPAIPLGILIDVITHIWHALTFENHRRGGGDYVPDFDVVT